MIPGLLIYMLTLAIDLITDYRIWLHKRTVNHIRGGLLRCIGLIPAMWLLKPWGLGLVFTYWMLFDVIYGVLIARNPFFLGSTSRLDRLQFAHRWLVAVKFTLGIAGVIIFVYGNA